MKSALESPDIAHPSTDYIQADCRHRLHSGQANKQADCVSADAKSDAFSCAGSSYFKRFRRAAWSGAPAWCIPISKCALFGKAAVWI